MIMRAQYTLHYLKKKLGQLQREEKCVLAYYVPAWL